MQSWQKNPLAISKQAIKRPTIFCWVERIYVGTKPKDDDTISFIIFWVIKHAPNTTLIYLIRFAQC
jgi:hypothetical protein